MPGHVASPRPKPFQSHQDANIHLGEVTVTGTATVDLGINHNNFKVIPSIRGGLTSLAPAHIVAWDYGTKKGTFVITVGKATNASTTTVIAATAAVVISFIAYEEPVVPTI